jgi:ankyrin repeat protein
MVPNMKTAALLLLEEEVIDDFLAIQPKTQAHIRLFFALVNANMFSFTDPLLARDSSYLMSKYEHGSNIYHAMCALKNSVGFDYIMGKSQAPMLINERDATGKTPLQIAIINKWSHGIKILMTTPGINITSRDNNDRNALFFAVETNNLALVKILLSKHKTLDFVNNGNNDHKDSPLSLAVRIGQVDIINLLISIAGIDVNMGPPEEPNLLFIIAKGHLPSDLQTTLFNLTVSKIPLIDARNNIGETPLMIAAANDNIDFVNLWIALPDRLTGVQDSKGDTALHHAMRQKPRTPDQLQKQEAVVRALLEANPALSTIRNRQGRFFGLGTGLRASSKLIAGLTPLRILIKTRAANRKNPVINTNRAVLNTRRAPKRK